MTKIGLVIALIATQPATASQIIRCDRAGSPPISIALDSEQQFGASLDCVEGSFVWDMTPCAPKDGYGLSAPTGGADLVGVAHRWQEYTTHTGPILGHHITPVAMSFNAGFYGGSGSMQEWWILTIDRIAGTGTLKLNPEQAPRAFLSMQGKYACRAVARKF